MKALNLIIVLFALSGLMTFGFSDVSASHGDNPGKSLGCKNDTAKKNPHCDDNGEDPPSDQLTACDTNSDGTIDQSELEALGLSDKQAIFQIADVSDGTIDSDQEVRKLNRNLEAFILECV